MRGEQWLADLGNGNGNGDGAVGTLYGTVIVEDDETDGQAAWDLDVPPPEQAIAVVPLNEAAHDAGPGWVSNVTDSGFTLNLGAMPTTQAIYGWHVHPDAVEAEEPDGGDPPFTPADLDDLEFWFASDEIDGLDDDDPVPQWDDLSGNDRHAVQATTGNQPAYKEDVLNGRPVVRFDGTNDRLVAEVESLSLAQPNTVFVVARRTGATERQYVYDAFESGFSRHLMALLRNGSFHVWAASGSGSWLTDGSSDTDWHVFGGLYNGGSSWMRTDGAQFDGSVGAGAHQNGLVIGANLLQSADFLEGDVGEIIFVSRQLTGEEIDQVETYLQVKYDLFFEEPPVKLESTFGDLGSSSATRWAFGGLSSVSGDIYGAPFEAGSVLRIDPSTDTVDTFGSGLDDSVGAIEGDDDMLYCPPAPSGTVLRIDPSDDSTASFGDPVPSGHGWYDGVLAGNGCIYCPPVFDGDAVLKIDPGEGEVTQIGSLNPNVSWGGAVLADTGDVYCPPRSAQTALKIDPSDDTVTEVGSGLTSSSRAWSGGVKDPVSGRIYCTPKNETRVLVIDPDDDSTYYITGLPSGSDKWAGAVAKIGLLFMFPRRSNFVLVIDPDDDSFELVPFDTTGLGSGDRFVGAVEAGDFVYSIPANSPRVAKWSFPENGS